MDEDRGWSGAGIFVVNADPVDIDELAAGQKSVGGEWVTTSGEETEKSPDCPACGSEEEDFDGPVAHLEKCRQPEEMVAIMSGIEGKEIVVGFAAPGEARPAVFHHHRGGAEGQVVVAGHRQVVGAGGGHGEQVAAA